MKAIKTSTHKRGRSKQEPSLHSTKQDIRNLDDFEEFLLLALDVEFNSPLREALIYSLENGKRKRAQLILDMCEHLSVPHSPALKLAAAIEMIHAFSLIQDDLPCMDNDLQRRGRATLHVKFGMSTALLTANCLFARAFVLLSAAANDIQCPQVAHQCIEELSYVTGANGMNLGQWYDLHGQTMSKNTLLKSYRLKSGLLFSACLTLPAILAKQKLETIDNLRDIGRHIGTIYQIKDDLEDYSEKSDLTHEHDANMVHAIGRKNTEVLKKELIMTILAKLENLGQIQKIIKTNIYSIVEA